MSTLCRGSGGPWGGGQGHCVHRALPAAPQGWHRQAEHRLSWDGWHALLLDALAGQTDGSKAGQETLAERGSPLMPSFTRRSLHPLDEHDGSRRHPLPQGPHVPSSTPSPLRHPGTTRSYGSSCLQGWGWHRWHTPLWGAASPRACCSTRGPSCTAGGSEAHTRPPFTHPSGSLAVPQGARGNVSPSAPSAGAARVLQSSPRPRAEAQLGGRGEGAGTPGSGRWGRMPADVRPALGQGGGEEVAGGGFSIAPNRLLLLLPRHPPPPRILPTGAKSHAERVPLRRSQRR